MFVINLRADYIANFESHHAPKIAFDNFDSLFVFLFSNLLFEWRWFSTRYSTGLINVLLLFNDITFGGVVEIPLNANPSIHSFVAYYFFFFMLGLGCAVSAAFVWSIEDQADVSLVGSTQHSLSSSLSESSDSDTSIATRRANIDATSWNAVERSFSFCSIFSTFLRLTPAQIE